MQKQNKAKFRSFTKRFQCIVCVTFMLMTTLLTVPLKPLEAKAATSYAISILGKDVTDANAYDILGDGVFSYDPAAEILTINGDCTRPDSVHGPVISNDNVKNLTIYVASDSALKTTESWPCVSLSVNTYITGPGTLTVEGKIRAIATSAKLTVCDATLHAVSTGTDRGSAAIGGGSDSGSLYVENSNLTAENKSSLTQGAITDLSEIKLSGCSFATPHGAKLEKKKNGGLEYEDIVGSDGKSAHYVEIQGSDRGISYSVVPNTKAIKKDCYNDPDLLAGVNGTLEFSAAGNERESGQLILQCDSDQAYCVIDTYDLRNANGDILSAENTEVFFERYIYEKENERWNITDTEGYHADALLPYELAQKMQLNNIRVEDGKNQGIWFTVNVPAEQARGIYKGNYMISFPYSGYDIIVPVVVEVYNFDLPDQTYSRNFFLDFNYNQEIVYKDRAGFDVNTDYETAVNNFLIERKLGTGRPNADRTWAKSNLENGVMDYINRYADAVYDYVTTAKSPYYNLDFGWDAKSATTAFNDFDFDISDDYLANLNNEAQRNQVIENKKQEITEILEKIYDKELTQEEKDAVDFAVDNYLYFGIKYYTGTLTDDEVDKYLLESLKKSFENQKAEAAAINDKKEEERIKYYNAIKANIEDWHYDADTDRLYRGLILSGTDEGIALAKDLYSQTRYSQYDYIHNSGKFVMFGVETTLKALADKCFSERKDIIQYSYLYCGNIDEPDLFDYWANYKVLVNSKVIDDSKEAVKEYINEKYADDPMKAQVLQSIDDILFLPTITTTSMPEYTYELGAFKLDNVKAYSSELYHGLGYIELDEMTETMPMKVFKSGFEKGMTADDAEEYTVNIPADYTVNSYCPLFNDFSPTVGGGFDSKDHNATIEALNDPDYRMWWYSCQSHADPQLACNFLGGNVNTKDERFKIKGNSLAIDRINKWQQFKLGIEGELYWAVDQYKKDGGYNRDIWTETSYTCNEGSMIYPIYSLFHYTLGMREVDAREICEQYGYFASSIRLENLGEGNDDYDYLCMANDLIKKAALAGEPSENIAYWNEYIDDLYDSMFDDVNYDETANSENLRAAREKLAKLIENLQTRTKKAVIYEVVPSDSMTVDVKIANNINGDCLSDLIHLDFNECTASVGSLMKKGNIYEYVLPVPDLPTSRGAITEVNGIYAVPYHVNDDLKVEPYNSSIHFVEKEIVDLVTPLRSSGYTVTRFWNKALDESYPDWKTSNKQIVFEVKEAALNCEKGSEDTHSFIYFNQVKPWSAATEMIKIDPVNGTLKNGSEDIGTVIPLDYGWYRVTVPFRELTERTEGGDKTIDLIESTWINRSFAIRNISITDTLESPTGIRPVNRTIWGDANCDGGVDLSDAILIMQSIANPNKYGLGGTAKTAITEKGKELADVDTSVKGLTGNDAVMIQKYLLKLISSLDPSE